MGKKSSRERLDTLMVIRNMVKSKTRAQALIMEGKVYVNDRQITKPGTKVPEDAVIEIKGNDIPYVSRGGIKLEAALKKFNIDVKDKVCIDVGASTGGFTDCLLKFGARKVYSIDVGKGLLDYKLRNDPRVVCMEGINIRHMPAELVPEKADFICVDVSFISLKKVIPKLKELIKPQGEIVLLVKPQFEVGRKFVSRGGIVKDETKRLEALNDIKEFSQKLGFYVVDHITSPIKGAKGNIEYLLFIKSP